MIGRAISPIMAQNIALPAFFSSTHEGAEAQVNDVIVNLDVSSRMTAGLSQRYELLKGRTVKVDSMRVYPGDGIFNI